MYISFAPSLRGKHRDLAERDGRGREGGGGKGGGRVRGRGRKTRLNVIEVVFYLIAFLTMAILAYFRIGYDAVQMFP